MALYHIIYHVSFSMEMDLCNNGQLVTMVL